MGVEKATGQPCPLKYAVVTRRRLDFTRLTARPAKRLNPMANAVIRQACKTLPRCPIIVGRKRKFKKHQKPHIKTAAYNVAGAAGAILPGDETLCHTVMYADVAIQISQLNKSSNLTVSAMEFPTVEPPSHLWRKQTHGLNLPRI